MKNSLKWGLGVTISGIVVTVLLWAIGPPNWLVPPDDGEGPEKTTPEEPTVEPSIGPLTSADRISGLPAHVLVPAGTVADEDRTLTFRGEEGDFIALTVSDRGRSLTDHFKLEALSSETPPDCCRNLLIDNGKVAVFRIPFDGQYRLESTLEPSHHRSVIVRAYRLQDYVERKLAGEQVLRGTISSPGDVDLYSVSLNRGQRLYIRIEVLPASDGERQEVGLIRWNDEGNLRGLWDPSYFQALRLGLSGNPDEISALDVETSILAVYKQDTQSDFDYEIVAKSLLPPKELTQGPERGAIRFPGDSQQYFVRSVAPGTTWNIELDCKPPLRARLAIADPVRRSESSICSDHVSETVEIARQGTLYLEVFGLEDTKGNFRLEVWPVEE